MDQLQLFDVIHLEIPPPCPDIICNCDNFISIHSKDQLIQKR